MRRVEMSEMELRLTPVKGHILPQQIVEGLHSWRGFDH